MPSGKGQKQHTSEGRGRNRTDKLTHYWTKDAAPIQVDAVSFRVVLIRSEKRGKGKKVNAGDLVTNITWDDNAAAETATVSMMQRDQERYSIGTGHEIKVSWQIRDQGNWHPLWRLRVMDITEGGDGTVELNMADEAAWLSKTKDDYSYKKGKGKSKHKRPKGWLCHQIARDVCHRAGIRVGTLATGHNFIENLTKEGTDPISVITEAYARERKETGKLFVIRIRRGRLEVVTLKRSKFMLIAGAGALAISFSRALKDDFATRLMVTGTGKGKGKRKKKIEVTVNSSKKRMRRYGVIRDEWKLPEPVNSTSRARKKAKTELLERQKPKEALQITLPGWPTVKKGDAVKARVKNMGLNEMAYVAQASHSVSPGDYTMDLTMRFTDPFVDKEGDKIRQKLCEKARKHGRKEPDFCAEGFDPFKPRLGRHRGDHHQGDKRPNIKTHFEGQ